MPQFCPTQHTDEDRCCACARACGYACSCSCSCTYLQVGNDRESGRKQHPKGVVVGLDLAIFIDGPATNDSDEENVEQYQRVVKPTSHRVNERVKVEENVAGAGLVENWKLERGFVRDVLGEFVR